MATVFVIASNRLFRESLVRLFRSDRRIQLLGAAEFSSSIEEDVRRANPEIVALNPESDDVEFCATRAIHQVLPKAKILTIGMKDDQEMFSNAVRAGAVGYLLKDAAPKRILAATHQLEQNCVVCPPHLLCGLFHRLAEARGFDSSQSEETPRLTSRERQLHILLAEGLADKEIAERLNLSLGTVKTHVHHILQKTQSRSRIILQKT